jgi:hypothetical protein
MNKLLFPILVAILILFPQQNSSSYNYCGFHDNAFAMTAYHWNSEFWVNMLVNEAQKWGSVISWIGESDLNNNYGLSWVGTVGWTITWTDGTCGNTLESDMFFNPGITLFTEQVQVPYNLGYQEIALHELGHTLTLGHENGSLSVMTSGNAVSNVLHHNDKVGWLRSADFRFSVTDRRDMGVFPLRNNGAGKIYSTITPSTVSRENNLTIRNITVENLSSGLSVANPVFDVILENVSGSATVNIGNFFWGSFGPFSQWSGNLTWRVPSSISPGTYRVIIDYRGSDSDLSNDRATIGPVIIN